MPSAPPRPDADFIPPLIGQARVFLLLGHGSREPESNAEFEQCVASWGARRRDGARVAHAYVELARPSLEEAIAALAPNASEVIVVPCFLFAAGHVKNDLPLVLQRARLRFPRVRFLAAAPLGVHPELARLAFSRAQRVASLVGSEAGRTALVVVGRGSSDPDANADFCKLVRLTGEGRGLLRVEPAFAGITQPLLSDVLEHVSRANPARTVVVPYLLFAGRLVDRLRSQTEAFARTHPWIKVALAPPLGAEPEILALLDTRAEQARTGQSPLPCDNCLYRTKLDGFAEQVGGLRALLWSIRHVVTHTQAVPHEHAHRPIKKHVLVCGNADCADRGSLPVLDGLRRAVKRAGLQREVRVTKTSCMGRCGEGPAVVIYPDGVWYRRVQVADVDDLVGDHIQAEKLVARIVDNVMQ